MPSLTFEQAVRQYQAKYPGGATRQTYEALFPYLQKQGFQVERPTRAGKNPDGSPRLSSDKIVDSATGAVYDIIGSVDDVTGAGSWAFYQDPEWGYWVDGRPSRTGRAGGGSTVLGVATAAPPQQARSRNSGIDALVRGARGGNSTVLGAPVDASAPYAAAQWAAMKTRGRAGSGGRQSTILGGFAPGRPTTRPTVLGGYR